MRISDWSSDVCSSDLDLRYSQPPIPNPESRIPNPESRIPAYMNPIILTDIEGTTSSISFVKDVLFPYARQALPGFVRARGGEPEVRQWLDQVAMENGGVCQDAMIVETLQGWIAQDRKHTAHRSEERRGGKEGV